MNTGHLFIVGFLITVGFITYDELSICHDWPWPPRFMAAALVFAMLDMMSLFSPELSGVVAIGFTIATVVNTLQQQKDKNNNSTGSNSFMTTNCQHANGALTSFQSLQSQNQNSVAV